MLKCPHCGNTALSYWQKINLGTLKPKKCVSCGNTVVAHKASFLLPMLIIFVAVAFRPLQGLTAIQMVLVAILIMIGGAIVLTLLPLVRHEA